MELTKYKKLPRVVKAVATRYWLAVLLERRKLQNLNQLSREINNVVGQHSHYRCSASFLYKKWDGMPVDNERKITLMNKLVPGAHRCLTNPLWQLFTQDRKNQRSIDDILNALSEHVTHSIFKPQADMANRERLPSLSNSNIKTIGRINHPDTLTCLLALALEPNAPIRELEKLAYQIFIRLISFTPLYAIKNELYALIFNHIFPKSRDQCNDFEVVGFGVLMLPYIKSKESILFRHSFIPVDRMYLDRVIIFHRIMANDMASLGLIESTPIQKMLFSYLLENTDRGWIMSGIHGLKNNESDALQTPCMPQLLKQLKTLSRLQ